MSKYFFLPSFFKQLLSDGWGAQRDVLAHRRERILFNSPFAVCLVIRDSPGYAMYSIHICQFELDIVSNFIIYFSGKE